MNCSIVRLHFTVVVPHLYLHTTINIFIIIAPNNLPISLNRNSNLSYSERVVDHTHTHTHIYIYIHTHTLTHSAALKEDTHFT
jgi:hypothetical protein